MYNGIGLRTARGSGTNGYVQKNLSFIKPKRQNNSQYKYDEEATAAPSRKPSDEVLIHKSRRQIENELIDYEESLTGENKYSEEEVQELVQKRREELLADLDRKLESMKEEVLVEAKEREMKKMKSAFGIEDDAEEGRVFKKFENEKQRQLRLERERANYQTNPVCTKPLSDCSEMGNDGGSIQKRSEMVKVKQKDAVIDDAEIIKTLWTCCYLSKEPLERPVVACGLGRLYNKDAVVKYLLNKTTSIPEFEHIRSLKSVFEVKLTDSTAPGSPYFACPLTGREMNGKSRFVVVKGCGCVFAEQALRELPATGRCLLCERDNNGGAMEIIPLNGKPEEIQELRRSLKPSKKRASSSDDKPAPAKPVVEENKAKALLEEIQSTTLGIQTLKKNKVLESIYK